MAGTKKTANALLDVQIGGEGTEFLFGTTNVTGENYTVIVIHADATFTALEDTAGNDLKAGLGIAANTIVANTIIRSNTGLNIARIQLATGSAIGII
jgi:hypothetical protein